jgi:type IV secretory pathway VirB2 component (pilin)
MIKRLIPLALAIGVLIPTAATAQQGQYEWQGQFQVTKTSGATPANVTLKGGPFPTQQSCYSNAGTSPQAQYPGDTVVLAQPPGFTCTCDKPLSQQSSCPDYVAPAAGSQTPSSPSSPTTPTPSPSPSSQAAPAAGNQGFVPLTSIPGLTQNVSATSGGIATFLNNLYKFLVGLAAILAVIMIVWAGLEWSTAGDNASKVSAARNRITQAVFGLILVLAPYLVFYTINPSILNLSVNFPPLDTSAATAGSPTGGIGGGGGSGVGTGGTGAGGAGTGQTSDGGSSTGASGPGTPGGTSNGSGSSDVTAPGNLQVAGQTATDISLSWSPPSSGTAASYNIYDNGKLVGSSTGTSASVSSSNLAAGSQSFTVTAVDTAGKESATSNTATATISPVGHYVISAWQWYDNTAITSGTTKTTPARNCWTFQPYMTELPTPYQSGPSGTGKPIDMLSACQQQLTMDQSSDATKAAQYPGYKPNSYVEKCTFVPQSEFNVETVAVGAPGPTCQ